VDDYDANCCDMNGVDYDEGHLKKGLSLSKLPIANELMMTHHASWCST